MRINAGKGLAGLALTGSLFLSNPSPVYAQDNGFYNNILIPAAAGSVMMSQENKNLYRQTDDTCLTTYASAIRTIINRGAIEFTHKKCRTNEERNLSIGNRGAAELTMLGGLLGVPLLSAWGLTSYLIRREKL